MCRLAATFLAVTGLLSHGLAMLLVSWLAQAQAVPGAYGEICTAQGLVTTAQRDGKPAEDGDSAPGRPGAPIHGCPVCAAFSQAGAADLPQLMLPPAEPPAASPQRPLSDRRIGSFHRLAALSRGPPAAA